MLQCNKPIADGAAEPHILILSIFATLSNCREGTSLLLNMLKAKLHSATVTQCDLQYEGSVSIDQDLLDASGILPHERVDIWNVTNGARIQTYALEAPRGSRTIGVNGAAARHFAVGDKVIIAAFASVEAEKARQHAPNVVLLDDANAIKLPA
jgi:aspartate 1-decarboxylase